VFKKFTINVSIFSTFAIHRCPCIILLHCEYIGTRIIIYLQRYIICIHMVRRRLGLLKLTAMLQWLKYIYRCIICIYAFSVCLWVYTSIFPLYKSSNISGDPFNVRRTHYFKNYEHPWKYFYYIILNLYKQHFSKKM